MLLHEAWKKTGIEFSGFMVYAIWHFGKNVFCKLFEPYTFFRNLLYANNMVVMLARMNIIVVASEDSSGIGAATSAAGWGRVPKVTGIVRF